MTKQRAVGGRGESASRFAPISLKHPVVNNKAQDIQTKQNRTEQDPHGWGGGSQSLEIAFVGCLNLFSFLIMKHQKVDNLQRAKGCLAPSSRRWGVQDHEAS